MVRSENVYDKMKSKRAKGGKLNFQSALKQEETYWIGAAIPAILFAGLIDGGVSIAFAYGARQLYKQYNEIR